MEIDIFGRLVVPLDRLAPSRGAFAHALAWASHLRLPVRVISLQPSTALPDTLERDKPEARLKEACIRACARHGLSWELVHRQGSVATGVLPVLEPADLLVLGQAVRPSRQAVLLRQALWDNALPVLVCPDDWSPPARILVLDQGHGLSASFLAAAGALARCFAAELIVLTAAGSERAARLSQRDAEQALATCGLDADFDFIVGSDVPTAVVNVARWRRCPLVLMERQASPPWWRWRRGQTLEQLADIAPSLALLAIPSRMVQKQNARPEVSDAKSRDVVWVEVKEKVAPR